MINEEKVIRILTICEKVLGIFIVISFIYSRFFPNSGGLVWGFVKLLVLPLFITNTIFLLSSKKTIIKFVIILSIVFVIFGLINDVEEKNELKNRNKPLEIEKVLDNRHNHDMTISYFFHNNKIYYYKYEKTMASDNKGFLFESELSGEYNKKICTLNYSDRFDFKYIFGDDAYFTLSDKKDKKVINSLKKINLNNCKVTDVIKDSDDIMIDQIHYNISGDRSLIYGSDYDENNSYWYNYDLNVNKFTENKKIGYDYSLFYANTMDIYDIDNNEVYRNDEVIINTKGISGIGDAKILLCSDSYVYLYNKKNIYQFDISNGKLLKKINRKYKSIKRLDSIYGDYFYINSNIYEFDTTNNKFKVLIKNIPKGFVNSKIYTYADKYIFITDKNDYENNNKKVKPCIFIYSKNYGVIYKKTDLSDVKIDAKNIYVISKNKDIKKIDLDNIETIK